MLVLTEETTHDLLSHLMDSVYLQAHPLTAGAMLGGDGERLRALLLESLERLKPPVGTPVDDPSWRPHRALRLRYVELRSPARVQEALGLSERQVRREQQRGIVALTGLLAAALGQAEVPDGAAVEALRRATQALTVNPVRLDAFRLLREMEPLWRQHLTGLGVRLRLDPVAECPIYADRITLRHVLLRLLGALAALGRGGEIGVACERGDDEIDLSLRLEPAPPGLALDEAVLAECQHLAELTLGNVWQEIEPRELRLHCVVPARQPLVLLVIDDEKNAPRLIDRCLQGYGVRVIAVERAVEALETALAVAPDAIALDVLMPGRDGWEVLQQLQSLPETRQIPIVVCSVWQEPELALSLGAKAFIRKPVTRPLLVQALAQALPRESGARFRQASP